MLFRSSDTSLIVSRRLILEGAKIKAIIESSDELRATSEYAKKIVDDFNIPVLFSHRVNEVIGNERIEEIKVSKLEDIEDSQIVESLKCDCLLISVNFLPDKRLGEMLGLEVDSETQGISLNEDYSTNIEGVFAAGGVVRGYDNADACAKEGKDVAREVVKYCEKTK